MKQISVKKITLSIVLVLAFCMSNIVYAEPVNIDINDINSVKNLKTPVQVNIKQTDDIEVVAKSDKNISTQSVDIQSTANDLKINSEGTLKPKKTFKKILLKFIFTMIWVFVSSAIIYLILLSYKKFMMSGRKVKLQNFDNTLKAPKNFKEAINLFLEKTKWD